MALTDEQWDRKLEVLRIKAAEAGVDTSDFAAMLELLREHWALLDDDRGLGALVDAHELAELEGGRERQQLELEATDARIADLKRGPR